MDNLLFYVSILSLVIHFVIYLKQFLIQNLAYKMIATHSGFSILAYFFVFLEIRYQTFNIGLLSNIFTSVDFLIWSIFYYNILQIKIQKKIIKIIVIATIIIIISQYLIFPEMLFKFNLLGNSIFFILMITYIATHFYNMLDSSKTFYLISVGLLVYELGTFTVYLTANLHLNHDRSKSLFPFDLFNIICIISQIFPIVCWIKYPFEKTIKTRVKY
jgi:hypothetical protein